MATRSTVSPQEAADRLAIRELFDAQMERDATSWSRDHGLTLPGRIPI
jgi:hypothetical protein